MSFRWPWSRKPYPKDKIIFGDGRAIVSEARLEELLKAEHRLCQINAQRSASTRKGNLTKAAKRRAEQAVTTAELRGGA